MMGDHSSLAPGDASYKDQVAPPPGQVSCHWCLAGHVTTRASNEGLHEGSKTQQRSPLAWLALILKAAHQL